MKMENILNNSLSFTPGSATKNISLELDMNQTLLKTKKRKMRMITTGTTRLTLTLIEIKKESH